MLKFVYEYFSFSSLDDVSNICIPILQTLTHISYYFVHIYTFGIMFLNVFSLCAI